MHNYKKHLNIAKYKSWVFDCDGVLLNSNSLKTDAFNTVSVSYGKEAADKLVQYHVENGGISRYHKFEHFLTRIIGKKLDVKELESLLDAFANEVIRGLLQCEIASGLTALCTALDQCRKLVVSGGDQSELRQVFFKRGISNYFDGGIFGSPDSKDEILYREIKEYNIVKPAIYIGDSKYDYLAAIKADIDFIFLCEWSEFSEWREYFGNNVTILNKIEDILTLI
jgi:phosphoglycolate phosphatase-like HAD superfamily hydrolase